MAPALVHPVSYGQVIEYIQDRLYLASYTHAPNENTPFPYPTESKRSPHKKSSRAQQGPTPVSAPKPPPVYFTIDHTLLYNAFHADFGPLHIGHLYRFAVLFHDVLGNPANNDRPVVFWSNADSRSRANAACMVACYMVLIQSWPPHLALAPIAQADPPYMPFRDAGYSQADFILNVQDVVYGVWKAKEENLVQLKEFDLEEYEKFERVDMGDFNWITPHFLAFASPQSQPIAPIPLTSTLYATLPSCIPEIPNAPISQPFKNVLTHFVERNVGLVVRLNSELYCPTYFTALGIKHIDMIFEDGTCPHLPLVRKFIKLAHETIKARRGIAVHCKAGLGRTGCLIGAYLIYRYGFTANEVIAFMRFMRPGMVVGPQQHWLHLNQGAFREWYCEDQMKAKLDKLEASRPLTPMKSIMKTPSRLTSNGQTATPPNGSRRSASRSALGEIDGNDASNSVPYQDENLPAPTPGQPRKYKQGPDSRTHPYSRSTSAAYGLTEKICNEHPDTEIVTMKAHRHNGGDNAESEEEYTLRMLAHRRSQSKSPNGKARSVSYTTTTTTMTERYGLPVVTGGIYQDSDAENMVWDELAATASGPLHGGDQMMGRSQSQSRPKTPASTGKSGNGVAGGVGPAIGMVKVRGGAGSGKDSPKRSSGEERMKVRKTSGRVGSASAQAVAVGGAKR